jgi:hypothetical protein
LHKFTDVSEEAAVSIIRVLGISQYKAYLSSLMKQAAHFSGATHYIAS